MHYIWEIVIYAIYRVYAPVPCNNQCYEGRSLCVRHRNVVGDCQQRLGTGALEHLTNRLRVSLFMPRDGSVVHVRCDKVLRDDNCLKALPLATNRRSVARPVPVRDIQDNVPLWTEGNDSSVKQHAPHTQLRPRFLTPRRRH